MLKVDNIIHGDALTCLKALPDECIDMAITSPPYWALRNYGCEGQLGLEKTPEEYINRLCDVFDEVKRVLKPLGTCWVNLGDCYANTGSGKGTGHFNQRDNPSAMKPKSECDLPSKCLVQIPSRFAIEMTNRNWILRNEIIWHKPSCMPSAIKDRFTVDFEKLFFFSKNGDYYFETQYEPLAQSTIDRAQYKWNGCVKALNEMDVNAPRNTDGEYGERFAPSQGRIKRCVWSIVPSKYNKAHFATYPTALIETPIKAGCPKGGIVLDPFFGSGTTGMVALKQNKHYIGIELNAEYIEIAKKRMKYMTNDFFGYEA